ncbi:UNVERIFIED_CONTAM: hypothetical protein FKN15_055903 [Acipenser sinensis]
MAFTTRRDTSHASCAHAQCPNRSTCRYGWRQESVPASDSVTEEEGLTEEIRILPDAMKYLLAAELLLQEDEEDDLEQPQPRTSTAGLDDGTGNVRKVMKVQTIKADGDDSWKIAHVTLHAKGKFRYVFQGTKGSQNTGGIFIDDISLTETRCPNGVWQIKNFTGLLNTTNKGDKLESPRFYSPEGYGFGATIYPHSRLDSTNEGYTSLYFHLCSGENDVVMEWPAANRQATITAMDQDPDIKSRMSSSRSFTTDNDPKWDKPVSGTLDPSCNCYRGPIWGWSTFISHKQLHRRSFLKNDDLIIFIDFEDLTLLVKTEVPINILKPSNILYTHERLRRAAEPAGNWEKQSAAQDPCDPNPCLNEGACVNRNGEASCRCVQRQMFLYAGERCESSQIHGDILGMLIGGAAGTLTLTIAVIAILTRRHR